MHLILFYSGFIALAAGLSVGMGGLAAGYAIGIVGDYVSNMNRMFYTLSNIFLKVCSWIC
jgi:V-type H+-transporting ATPase proteolipid subunit